MSTAPATPTYEDFVVAMTAKLEKFFTPTMPAATKRSPGLDPQVGLLLGFVPTDPFMELLADSLVTLPAVWSAYDRTTLHSTAAAAEWRDSTAPTDEHTKGYAKLVEVAEDVAKRFDGLTFLEDLMVLASGDTLILAGQPSPGMYDVRSELAAPASLEGTGISGPACGTHFTLARATRPLTDDERRLTTNWMGRLTLDLPETADVTHVLAGLFSADGTRFSFIERQAFRLGQK